MEKTQKVEAAGSLWNVNSWHWEAKDYTKDASELLTEKVMSIVIEKDGIKITHKSLKKIDGHAEICIRKQKQCFIYDLEAECEWFAETAEHEATGTYKVIDILPDDLEVHIDNVKAKEKSSISKDAERIIKKEMQKQYEEILKDFVPSFFKKLAEKNPVCLKEDAQKRQEISQAIQKAREENGDLKQQIFNEQKQKEQTMKEQNRKQIE